MGFAAFSSEVYFGVFVRVVFIFLWFLRFEYVVGVGRDFGIVSRVRFLGRRGF